jgi:hypothetical protein
MFIPAEFQIGGVFMPPFFVASILGTLVAVFTTRWLNRAGLSRYLFYPPLVFVALIIIYSVLIGTFIIPG